MGAPRTEQVWLLPRRVPTSGREMVWASLGAGGSAATLVAGALAWAATNATILAGLPVLGALGTVFFLGRLAVARVHRQRERLDAPSPVAPGVSVRVRPSELLIRRRGEGDVVVPRTVAGGIAFDGAELVVGEQRVDASGIRPDALSEAVARMGWDKPLQAEPSGILEPGPDAHGWENLPAPAPVRAPRRYQAYRPADDDGEVAVVEDAPRWSWWPVPASAWCFLGLSVALVVVGFLLQGAETGNAAVWSGLVGWLPWAVCGWWMLRDGYPYGRTQALARRYTLQVGTEAIDLQRGDGRTRRFVAGKPLIWDATEETLTQRGKQPLALPGFDIDTLAEQARERGWDVTEVEERA